MRSRSESQALDPPEFAGRIHYLIGGMLPAKYREWVEHDLTGPGWRHRAALRPVLLMLPFAIAFVFLPGQASVRASIPLALLLIALVMGYTTGEYFRNRRLDQYGMERPRQIEEDEYLDELPAPAPTPAAGPSVASQPATPPTHEHDPDDE